MIKERLASNIGRRNEEPNIDLAKEIIQNQDVQSIKELVALLKSKQNEVQNDCIKVLYEVGEMSPNLIVEHYPEFLEVLKSKNNRLQWGAMTALKTISLLIPADIYNNISTLKLVVDQGSVITRDNFVAILVNLIDQPAYEAQVFDLLLNQIQDCPTNQLPMYVEMAANKITKDKILPFRQVVISRMNEVEKISKIKRLEKVLKKLS